LYLDLVDDISGLTINGKFNNGAFFSGKFPKKNNKVNRKLMVLMEKGGVCVFDDNLREVNVCFKIRGSVNVILVNLKGDECNFPQII